MAVKESNQQVTFLRKLIPGAADTSYGIYCARIAGLPESIIQRSYTLLNGFNAREAITPYEAQQVAATVEPIVQLSLFAEADKPQTDKVKKKMELKTEQVVDELRNADIINMTPLQAMNFVYELKKKLAEK
jgi:DNA mismatch repair protein MutS